MMAQVIVIRPVAPILLSFLLQLTQQGWTLSEGLSRSRKKVAWTKLRSMWKHETAPCPSCGRGLAEQRAEQCADSVHILSSILARHAQAAWGEALHKNAEATHPLVRKALSRVGRLRGYGNALCAPQAEAFIRAYRSLR